MNVINLFKIALRAIAANKLRSFLTMLGIIIGVASVIAMLAIGQGSKQSIQANIAEMGSNMIMIRPGQDKGPGGARGDASEMQSLKLKDYETLCEQAKYLAAISPSVSASGQFIYGNNNTPSTVYGISPDYMEIRRLKVEDGEMFTEDDIKTSAKVCLIGKTVADNLFPDGQDPVGRVIRYKSIPLRVIGVIKAKGYNSFGMDQDDMVLAPYTTVMKRILSITYLQGINASALTEDMTDQAIDDISELLRQNHKIKEGDEDDFTIRSQQEMMQMMNSTSDTMTILLLVVACISLVVGGIGIMNIMYVSVTERTHEIGLRKAIGAKRRRILTQFLTEAAVLTGIGGLLGVLGGIGLSKLIAQFMDTPSAISVPAILAAAIFSILIGLIFGLVPAVKASKLNPIEALRRE